MLDFWRIVSHTTHCPNHCESWGKKMNRLKFFCFWIVPFLLSVGLLLFLFTVEFHYRALKRQIVVPCIHFVDGFWNCVILLADILLFLSVYPFVLHGLTLPYDYMSNVTFYKYCTLYVRSLRLDPCFNSQSSAVPSDSYQYSVVLPS